MGSKKISELTEISTDDFNPAAAYMIIEQGGVTYKMRMNTGFIASDTSAGLMESKTSSIAKVAGQARYNGSTITFNIENIVSRATALQIQMSCVNTERGWETNSNLHGEPLNRSKSAAPLSKPSGLTLFNGNYSTSSSFNVLIGAYSGYAYISSSWKGGQQTTTPLTSSVYATIASSEDSLSIRPYILHNEPLGAGNSWWLNTWIARHSSCLAASVTVSVSGTIRS